MTEPPIKLPEVEEISHAHQDSRFTTGSTALDDTLIATTWVLLGLAGSLIFGFTIGRHACIPWTLGWYIGVPLLFILAFYVMDSLGTAVKKERAATKRRRQQIKDRAASESWAALTPEDRKALRDHGWEH